MINLDTAADVLESFLRKHLVGLDRPGRVSALVKYAMGLGLEITEKTALGIGKRLAPHSIEGTRQAIQDALLHSRFEGSAVFEALARTFTEQETVEAYVVDDTGFAKNGELSVGVKRQYSGTLGKVGNCQVAVSVHAVSDRATGIVGAQLYLPKDWSEDALRRKRARVPASIAFKTKPEIALDLIRGVLANGAPRKPVIADAGYGDSRDFRDALEEMDIEYSAAVSSQTKVWPPDAKPVVPKIDGRGRPPTFYKDPTGIQPIFVAELATKMWDRGDFKKVVWRPGYPELSGEFAAVRVRSAERTTKGLPPSGTIDLLLERDPKQKTRFKYYILKLDNEVELKVLVQITKQRWKVEYDYREMKQHLGLDSYEGRSWGGFHRHFAMVSLMHAFVGLHRESFSPSGRSTINHFSQGIYSKHPTTAPGPNTFGTTQLARLPQSFTPSHH